MQTIQYFIDSNNFFLSLENIFDSRKLSFFIQIIFLETRIIYFGQENIINSVIKRSLLKSIFKYRSISIMILSWKWKCYIL